MTLLLWTLLVPVVTALLGVPPVPRWLKEANLVGGRKGRDYVLSLAERLTGEPEQDG